MSRKAAFHNLGCKVNSYEMDVMLQELKNKGYEIVPFEEKADIYIVNTCTVTNIADRKSRQMLHKAKKTNPEGIVVAVGCYVQSDTQGAREDDAVDLIIGNNKKKDLVSILENYMNGVEEEAVIDINHTDEYEEMKLTGTQEHTRSYIKIQDGCNQFCTYCMIPYVRGKGKLVSMPEDEIISHVESLAKQGYKEVVLTGIHLSSYGVDFSDALNFVSLEGKPLLAVISKVAEIEGVERIRLGSLEPRIITESFAKELSAIKKVCPHFHLSLQSGCDTVLKRMNRHYTSAEYKEKVEILRKYFDYPAITTDVITGFPGETEEEFLITRNFLREIAFSDLHIFPYSPRRGTKAAAMTDQVDSQVKKHRSDLLIQDTKEYQKTYADAFLSKQEKVLFEEVVSYDGKEYLIGHNERYVKIGVLASEAAENGYGENEIHEVLVEHVLV